MLKKYSDRFLIRILSLVVIFVTMGMELLTGSLELSMSAICPCIMSGALIVQFTPVSYENAASQLMMAIISIMLLLTALNLSVLLGIDRLVCVSVMSSAVIIPGIAMCTLNRYREEDNFFGAHIIWYNAEDNSRMVGCLLYMSMCIWQLCLNEARQSMCIHLATITFTLLLFCLLYYKSYSGKTLIMSEAMEKRMMTTAVKLSKYMSYGSPDELVKMEQLFHKIERIMQKEKPYLNPDFTLEDLAEQAYANRTYISKTIYAFSGIHYCRYINRYRVMEATKIIEQNPNIKIVEQAIRSGFNSAVTYNAAFKDIMGTSPGKYSVEIKLRRLLSNRQEQEQ